MIQRARLTFDRNQDESTAYYRIYRGTRAGVTTADRHIITVVQPEGIHPVKVDDELLTRVGPGRYRSRHRNWLIDFPPVISVNGAAPAGNCTVDYNEGSVTISPAPAHLDEVKAAYTFDGLRVLDHDGDQPMAGVVFHGPAAYDQNSPAAPEGILLTAEPDRSRIFLTWTPPSSPGTVFYYRTEAVDRAERRSLLSPESHATLVDNLDPEPFIVEARPATDATAPWVAVGERTRKNAYVATYADLIDAPLPAHVLTADSVLDPVGKTVDLHVTWTVPDQSVDSPMYRVRAVNKNQRVSDPSKAAGPVRLQAPPSTVLIRRMESTDPSGLAVPTPDGQDATTLAELPGTVTDFTDTGLPEHSAWVYALYVRTAGKVSAATVIRISIGDLTDASPVPIVTSPTWEEGAQ